MNLVTDPRQSLWWKRLSIGATVVLTAQVLTLHDLLLTVPLDLAAGASTFAAAAAVAVHRKRGNLPAGRSQTRRSLDR